MVRRYASSLLLSFKSNNVIESELCYGIHTWMYSEQT